MQLREGRVKPIQVVGALGQVGGKGRTMGGMDGWGGEGLEPGEKRCDRTRLGKRFVGGEKGQGDPKGGRGNKFIENVGSIFFLVRIPWTELHSPGGDDRTGGGGVGNSVWGMIIIGRGNTVGNLDIKNPNKRGKPTTVNKRKKDNGKK